MLRNILLLLSFLVLQICNGNSNLPASNSPSSSTLKSIEKNIAEGPYTPVTSNASNPFSSSQQRRIWEKSGNKSIHDCLPWQFSLLRKLVPALRKSTEPNSIASISSASKSNNNNNLIQKGINLLKGHSQNVLTKISSWIQHHKKTFHFALKGFGLFVLAYWVIRRVISWYQDIAEYEVLLDQTDFVYQSYGCNLNGIGEWLLSSMNQTAINQFGYESLLKSLENSLDIPCFPQSMSTYAVQIGKDLVPVVLEVDSRLRSQDKVVKTVVMRDTKDRISSSRSKPKTREAVTYHIVTSMDPNEQRVLDGAVKALLLIQARQTDAILRSTRFRVLSALNTCEDLLHVWKSKLVQKTQTFRFPLTRNLVRYVPGVGRRIRVGALQRLQQALNSLNIGAMSHDLNLNRILHRTRRDKSVVTGSESALSESVSGTSRGNSTIDSSNPAVKRVDLSKPPSHSSTEKVSILFPGSIAGLRSINQTTSILDELTNAEVPPSSSPNSDTESETNVDTILKGLNAREKILFLEEMQAELYETVGRVQTQLDALSDIGNRLLLICKETSIVREALTESDASPYNLPEHVWSSRNAHLQHLPLVINRHVNSTEYLSKEQHIDIMEERQLSTWDELDAWVRSSSSLCRESLSLVSFDRHYDAKMDGSLGNERSQSTDGSQSASSRRVLDSMRSSSIQSSLKDKRTTRTGPTNIFPISARKSTDSVDRRASTGEASSSDSFSVDPLNSFQHTLKGNLDTVRTQWRTSEVMLRDLSRAPTQFEAHLESSGLRPHSFFGILGWLRVRNLRRFVLWGGVCSAVIEVTKRSEDIVVWGTVFGRNIKDFLHRRVVIPSIRYLNN